jgi:hypothetical protein
MAFPSSAETPPSLSEYGMSYSGYAWGPKTALEIRKLDGVDMPAVRSGDAGRPRDHGMFVGLDVMGDREVIVEGDLHPLTGTLYEAETALAAATVPGGSIQVPLYLNLPGFGTLASLARVRKRQMPRDIMLTLGKLGKVTLLFASSDPKWYATPTRTASVSPPNSTLGFKFPMTFNLSFGGGTVAGSLAVTNAGNIETRPLLTVEGPCENPSITNVTAPGSPNLKFNLTIAAGAKLVIDTDLHTATYYTAGSTLGSSRVATLAYGSQWWILEPGISTIQFLAGSTGEGKLSVQWASAYVI